MLANEAEKGPYSAEIGPEAEIANNSVVDIFANGAGSHLIDGVEDHLTHKADNGFANGPQKGIPRTANYNLDSGCQRL